MIPAVLWSVNALVSLILIKQVHSLYRLSGKNIQQAQAEVITAAASNATVREGVKDSILRNAV